MSVRMREEEANWSSRPSAERRSVESRWNLAPSVSGNTDEEAGGQEGRGMTLRRTGWSQGRILEQEQEEHENNTGEG
eukprot:746986-Hanusia_phi.AAC.1